MRASLLTWRGQLLAAALAVLAGAGVWLSVVGTGTSGPPPDQVGTVSPPLIAGQASRLRLLDFFWLGLGNTPGSITSQPDNPGGSTLETVLNEAAAAKPCGWRFITVSDARTPLS